MLAPVSALPPPLQSDRQLARRSPVNFREGRRSSDGLVAPVAFQQRLYDKALSPGLLQLDQVRQRRLNKQDIKICSESLIHRLAEDLMNLIFLLLLYNPSIRNLLE